MVAGAVKFLIINYSFLNALPYLCLPKLPGQKRIKNG